ncbi:hypothetical protein DOY81_013733 [Sarcophaga bullata]|nr:hypothetical protein DOY81_013733 [Sarcophaga bullata]
MENHTVTPVGAHILPTTSSLTYDIKLEFSPDTPAPSGKQLKHLIADKVQNKEFFYGIEISATNSYPNTLLDYRTFGPVLPLFTSIIWLSAEYWSVKNIEEVESIKLARKLEPHSVVLPHFSCYRLQQSRLEEFLKLNFSNILTVRGDFYDQDQEYKYSGDLVKTIRELRGDSVTIGVGGYPEGHPECASIDQDIDNLFKKVQAGS